MFAAAALRRPVRDMRQNRKPIRRCYTCLLNRGDHCWGYRFPWTQWTGRRKCPAFENEEIYAQFRAWQKQATVKSGREIRREAHVKRKPEPVPYLDGVPWVRPRSRRSRAGME